MSFAENPALLGALLSDVGITSPTSCHVPGKTKSARYKIFYEVCPD
jgi:hypothetical protein